MRTRKSATTLATVLDQAAAQARTQAAELGDRLVPALEDARDRLVPALEDARDRVTPVVEDALDRARERVAPVVADARDRLDGYTVAAASRLDERLPDRLTPAAVTDASAHSSAGRVRKLLVVLGLGAVAAAVAQRMRRSAEPTWQQPAATPSSPTPTPASTTPPTTAPTTAPAPTDAAGGTPGEAVADHVEAPHEPTTPDAPADEVDLKDS